VTRDLAARLGRVQRLVAKRPPITIEVTHAPSSGARDRLVELLVELLDEQRRAR
jgi:hypothetical protein